ITPKDSDNPFVTPPPHDDIVLFIKELGYPRSLEHKIKTVQVPKKKRTETIIKETAKSEEVADTMDSEKTDGEEEVDMKTAMKASKDDFILKKSSKGLSEGSGVILEVSDGPSKNFECSSSESEDEDRFLSTDDEAS
nr:hypothetical protein [Tanacetum cinerariifolium]